MNNKVLIFIVMNILAFSHLAFGQNDGPLFVIQEDGLWGYIDIAGDVVIEPQFDYAEDFSEGLAAVKVGTKYFYAPMNSTIPPIEIDRIKADSLSICGGNLEIREGKFGYINSTGEMVIRAVYDDAGPFNEGLAAINFGQRYGCCGDFDSGLWGYINHSGDTAIALQFEDAGRFSEELARAQNEAGTGFIDKFGQYVINTEIYNINDFKDGIAEFDNGWKTGFIDKTGKKYSGYDRVTCGLKIFNSDGKYGYTDTLGNVVINPVFDFADIFYEGKARVAIDDGWGFIDTTGKIICGTIWNHVYSFSDGMARIEWNGKIGYLDSTGSLAIIPQFKGADDFHNGLARVSDDWVPVAYINKTGDYVWRRDD